MKINRRLSRFVILLVFFSVTITGCWSRNEIEDLGIISAAALDAAPDDKVQLSLMILQPPALAGGPGGGGGGAEEAAIIISAEGNNVAEAARNIATMLPRKIFWSHNRLILIGGDLAKRGLHDLDFFSRERQTRLTSWVMVSSGKAADLLKVKTHLEKTPAESLAQLNRSQVSLPIQVYEFLSALSTEGVGPVVPRVDKTPSLEAGKGKEEALKLTGTAIFKENRLAGWANMNETRGLLWLRGEMASGVITIDDPINAEGYISVRIRDASRKLTVISVEDGLGLRVKIITDVDVEEVQQKSQVGNPQYIKAIEEAVAKEISDHCNKALALAKELRVDAFSFGAQIRGIVPDYWEQVHEEWDNVFSDIPVDIDVEVNIRRMGLRNNTMERKD